MGSSVVSRACRRPLRWSLAALCSSLSACVVYHPAALYDQSRPLPADYAVSGVVTAERCTSYLFGWLPLDEGHRMHELLDEARGGHDALIEVAVDDLSRGGLFVSRRCTAIRAYAVDFVRISTARERIESAAVQHEVSPEVSTTRVALPSTSGLTEGEARLLEMVYQALGRAAPSSAAELDADARALREFMDGDKTPSEAIAAAKAGVAVLGPTATLPEALKAGAK